MQSNNPSLAAVWWPGTRHNHISRRRFAGRLRFFVADFFGKVLSAILAGADDHANFRGVDFGHALRLASCHRRGAVIFG